MRKLLLAAGVAAVSMAAAAQANAGAGYSFEPGAASPDAGYTVIDTFDSLAGLVTSGDVEIKFPPADGNGAPPANSVPAGTNYLSVLAGGSAIYTFAKPVSSFEFDWGSVDSYNTLTIFTNDGNSGGFVTGSDVTNPANGNQGSPITNGVFVGGTSGSTLYTGFELTSSSNSFEIDNLAIPSVPEPATWAVMLTGFGGIGAMMRRRRAAAAFA